MGFNVNHTYHDRQELMWWIHIMINKN